MTDLEKKVSQTCSAKVLLFALLGLCVLMIFSMLIFWYHIKEMASFSEEIANDLKELYEKDTKRLLKVLKSTEFENKEMMTNNLPADIKLVPTVALSWKHVNEIFTLSEKLSDSVHNLFNNETGVLFGVLKLPRNKQTPTNWKSIVRNMTALNDSAIVNISLTKIPIKAPSKPPSDRLDNCESCFKHSFNYILDNDKICSRNDKSPEIDIVVMIFTIHKNRIQRDTIRRTWLTYAKNNSLDSNIRYAFLLGAPADPAMNDKVKEEFNLFKDILQEDFKDSYSNLTYKTMMAFKWASTKCKEAKFVMKTDDDMYVNIPNIITAAKARKDQLQTSVGGACHQKAQPIRDQRSKWYASKRSFPGSHYPGFCSGTGYVTSMNVVTKVFEVSQHVPFFHLEDVYVALCIRKLGYKLQAIANFNAGRFRADPCIYQGNTMMTSHQVPPDMMQKMWSGKCNRN
ncbi:beta-1,3-galactosyltransferase 1-like [Ylistrum balloti]|uniref:beta-1,3-galactosyltransferase 1-like n=1 Tax=Ylistrum balloti TaxID=509963 RepID=UPI002905C3AE|nr:beta-1,3-galactosyltransferase 1-like [Ylistrum balloti]